MSPFEGKVAVITGGSRGIGRALAVTLAAGGAQLVLNYKENEHMALQVCKAVEQAGGAAIAVRADVEDPEQIAALFAEAERAYGRVDHFVCNAAATSFKDVRDLTANNLDRSYAMNIRPLVLGAQHAVRLMPQGGRIVAMSSYGSSRVFAKYANLGAAKAAIEAWIRYMAVEFAPQGINVNALNGGIIDSDSSEYYYDLPGMAPLEGVLSKIPKGRMGTAQEVADVAAFLLSPSSEYVTGHTLCVDGGLSVVAPPFAVDLTAPPPRGA